MSSLRRENPSENNFCKRRAILILGISALPLLQLRAKAIEGLLKVNGYCFSFSSQYSFLFHFFLLFSEEQDVSASRPENLRNEEEVHRGEAQPNPILALLNALGIYGSGVLGALYALVQKEKAVTVATIESV
ncbi:hypothetical protein HHK36_006149 [Tetracentron sinense]|uniref:Uncharacterized protein n=1 Tax=Tetracentron sinense TaxID=13715 RepID=A0A834ZJW5_TETSI|nr:hypothetical protein HHK36_006149 [Tetracentron sinense]